MIGPTLSSAFPAIVVFAQALMPPLGQHAEIRRVGDDKTILPRVGDLPPSFSRTADWRLA